MTREDFRREMGDAFDSISGLPDPALHQRVRSALVEAPERRGPVWIAALAAAVIAVVLVGVLLVGNPLNRAPFVTGGHGTSTPTPCFPTCPLPQPSPSPSPSPIPSPVANPFICGASSTFAGTQAFIDAVRTGRHTGYDRLTIEFKNGLPGIELRPQSSSTFTTSGGKGGGTLRLLGQDGLLISIFSTDAHTAYSGPTDIKTGFTGLLEVRVLDDYEGYLHLGIGLSKPACYHAFILTNPTRLVIDIQVN